MAKKKQLSRAAKNRGRMAGLIEMVRKNLRHETYDVDSADQRFEMSILTMIMTLDGDPRAMILVRDLIKMHAMERADVYPMANPYEFGHKDSIARPAFEKMPRWFARALKVRPRMQRRLSRP